MAINTINDLMDRCEIDQAGCWIWQKAVGTHGYGVFGTKANGRSITKTAHRTSYELHCGAIPEGAHVLHKCDVRRCCNPDHLFLGTDADNVRDMIEKGRNSPPPAHRGARNVNAKLTEAAVRDIRSQRKSRREYAEQYGVSKPCVGYIQRGDTWQHVS